MDKLKETLNSKRFQVLALAMLTAVGAHMTGALEIGAMWEQIRTDLGVYLASIVAIQAPVEACAALRGSND